MNLPNNRIFFIPDFPVDKVANDGHELWIRMPETYRYKFHYLEALMENILMEGRCDPIRAYENPDGVVLGLSGVNRYQALLKLGRKTVPVLFFAESEKIPQKYATGLQEQTAESALTLITNRKCISVVDHIGYTYADSFDPLDFLVNFQASSETRSRMFTCFFLENLQNQNWGHSYDKLVNQLTIAERAYNLPSEYINICRTALILKGT